MGFRPLRRVRPIILTHRRFVQVLRRRQIFRRCIALGWIGFLGIQRHRPIRQREGIRRRVGIQQRRHRARFRPLRIQIQLTQVELIQAELTHRGRFRRVWYLLLVIRVLFLEHRRMVRRRPTVRRLAMALHLLTEPLVDILLRTLMVTLKALIRTLGIHGGTTLRRLSKRRRSRRCDFVRG